jgi:hypothetical protein
MAVTVIAVMGPDLNTATTVQVKKGTKRILDQLGRKGETYDDIIRQLIRSYRQFAAIPKLSDALDAQAKSK